MEASSSDLDVKKELQNSLKSYDVQRKALESEAEAILSELNAPSPGGGPPMGVDTPLVDRDGYPRNDIDIYRARHLRSRFNEIRTDHKALMAKVEDSLKKLALFVNPSNKERDEAEKKARMAPKPRPKFDPVTGKWVVSNWDGTISGVEGGHLRKFDAVNTDKKDSETPESSQPPKSNSPVSTATSSSPPTSSENKDNDVQNKSTSNKAPPIPFAIVNEVANNSPASSAGLKEGDLIVKFGTATYANHRQLKAIAELVPLAAADNQGIPLVILRRKDRNGSVDQVPISLKILPRPWSGRGLIGCHILPYVNEN